MTKQKNISHDSLREKLMLMAETLCDDEVMRDETKKKDYLARAEQLCEISKAMIDIDRSEIQEKEAVVHAMEIAGEYNFDINKEFGIANTPRQFLK